MDLKDVSSHFKFGENWQSYAALVTEEQICEAVKGLRKLVSDHDIKGKAFLDIGCGSGLSMLAALRMGAASVQGIDIDQNSVATAEALLAKFASGGRWSVQQQSVFDLDPCNDPSSGEARQFDVVYSWGVLHHTGEMWKAISKAASAVRQGGLLAIALYHKTPFCGFWHAEKRFYAHARPWQQRMIWSVYKGAYMVGVAATGKNPWKYISGYKTKRGMDWHHDVHDWLGGYPYESVLLGDVISYLQSAGFVVEEVFKSRARCNGLFGTGCDEYVARRTR